MKNIWEKIKNERLSDIISRSYFEAIVDVRSDDLEEVIKSLLREQLLKKNSEEEEEEEEEDEGEEEESLTKRLKEKSKENEELKRKFMETVERLREETKKYDEETVHFVIVKEELDEKTEELDRKNELIDRLKNLVKVLRKKKDLSICTSTDFEIEEKEVVEENEPEIEPYPQKQKRIFVIVLISSLILLFMFLILFWSIVVAFIKRPPFFLPKHISGLNWNKVDDYKVFLINFKQNTTSSGVVNFPTFVLGEDLKVQTFQSSHSSITISKMEETMYFCYGNCFCEPEEEDIFVVDNEFGRRIVKRSKAFFDSLVYLVNVGLAFYQVRQIAKDYFSEKCIEKLPNCPEDRVIGEVDDCEEIEEQFIF